MQSIVRLGYKVPADFSIIGFDDSLITDLTEPHISSVHYDYAAYGQKLIDTAVDAINGAEGPSGVCIPVSLTVKASCRKI
jgi:DNA-binding LacI/PurR family transcriptional regulator